MADLVTLVGSEKTLKVLQDGFSYGTLVRGMPIIGLNRGVQEAPDILFINGGQRRGPYSVPKSDDKELVLITDAVAIFHGDYTAEPRGELQLQVGYQGDINALMSVFEEVQMRLELQFPVNVRYSPELRTYKQSAGTGVVLPVKQICYNNVPFLAAQLLKRSQMGRQLAASS